MAANTPLPHQGTAILLFFCSHHRAVQVPPPQAELLKTPSSPPSFHSFLGGAEGEGRPGHPAWEGGSVVGAGRGAGQDQAASTLVSTSRIRIAVVSNNI